MTQVEKIHKEIDTAQDRLLREAILLISMNEVSEEMKTKAERLAKVGFTSNPVAKVVSDKMAVLVKNKAHADIITYYKESYPGLKFLTESEFDRICDKYDLMYAQVKYYVKDIPEQNLQDIEALKELKYNDNPNNFAKFIIDAQNTCVSGSLTIEERNALYNTGFIVEKGAAKDRGTASLVTLFLGRRLTFRWDYSGFREIEQSNKAGLFIAAPKTHFNLNGLDQKGRGFFERMKPEPKDPIVFRYVKGGIQVITKWGEEANDPNLIVF